MSDDTNGTNGLRGEDKQFHRLLVYAIVAFIIAIVSVVAVIVWITAHQSDASNDLRVRLARTEANLAAEQDKNTSLQLQLEQSEERVSLLTAHELGQQAIITALTGAANHTEVTPSTTSIPNSPPDAEPTTTVDPIRAYCDAHPERCGGG